MTINENIQLLYVDLFCGAGGTSTGVEDAKSIGETIKEKLSSTKKLVGYRKHHGLKCAKVIACVNHDENAIASHSENHPEALHFTEDIRTLNLDKLIAYVKLMQAKYPNAKLVLWASLECTNFSKAKGGLPRDADSRTLAEHLYRYIIALNPDYIQIENVEEFMSWGELDKKGKPISKTNGTLYRRWVNHVRSYGYDYDYRILNAADFGAYTSRKRFFGIFAKEGLPIVFPVPTHSKTGSKGLFETLLKWKPVKDCLDFLNEGRSIFDRKKPLVEATLARILAGLIMFVAGGKDKWLLKYNSVNGKTGKHTPPSIDDPCPTVAAQSILGVVQTTFLSKYFSGHPESKNVSIESPAGAITTKDHHSFINAKFLSAYYGDGHNHSVKSPSPTLTTKDRLSFISPKFLCSYNYKDKPKDINVPCPTLLTKDRLSLIQPFFMNNYTGGGHISSINRPSPAITSVPKQNLVQCQFIDQQFGQSKPSKTDKPLGAITTNPKYSLVSCKNWLMNTNFNNTGSSVDSPSPVITANRKWHYLMDAQYSRVGWDIERPCFTLIARMDKTPPYLIEASEDTGDMPSFIKIVGDTIVYEIYETDTPKMKEIKEFMALYGLIDIKMRMLTIPELKMIMGFPKDYKLIGTQAEQKKFIGNAVEVNMARVLCEALADKLQELKKQAA